MCSSTTVIQFLNKKLLICVQNISLISNSHIYFYWFVTYWVSCIQPTTHEAQGLENEK